MHTNALNLRISFVTETARQTRSVTAPRGEGDGTGWRLDTGQLCVGIAHLQNISFLEKMSGRTEKVTLFNAFLQAGLTNLDEIWHDGRS